MKPLRLAWMLLVVFSGEPLHASATSAVVHPIGITAVGTKYEVTCSEDSDCQVAMASICPHGFFPMAFMSPGYQFVCKSRPLTTPDVALKTPTIQVRISPECKDMFFGPPFLDVDSNGKTSTARQRPRPDTVAWDPTRAKPMSYTDPRSSITLYVESDGRHIAGIDEHGQLLWVRNPWEESHNFCPYRTPYPVVDSLTVAEINDYLRAYLTRSGANLDHRYITVQFDSSQFGVLDDSTGDFYGEGQN